MQLSVLLLLAAILQVTFGQTEKTDYCKLSKDHTMCKFPGLGPICQSVLGREISPKEKLEIVDTHNRLRARVANRKEAKGRPGPQGPAADMMELVWDEEIAEIAQRWADQCDFGHDQIRSVSRFHVGQNVFMSFDPNPGPVDFQQAVNGWYDEVKEVDAGQSDVYSFSSGTGHFTQMVWSSTRTIGCGLTIFKKDGFINKYVVCNYGPGGNIIGSPIYKRGSACSACPNQTTCSTDNPGLCH